LPSAPVQTMVVSIIATIPSPKASIPVSLHVGAVEVSTSVEVLGTVGPNEPGDNECTDQKGLRTVT
jgi:hypothetical protein